MLRLWDVYSFFIAVIHQPSILRSADYLVWAARHWLFYANEYEEIGARNRATGQKLVLRVEKIF
jgi:hypothetical protein